MGCSRLSASGWKLVVLRLQLEEGLGMGTHGADLGGLLAHMDMAAVAALPNHVAVAGEHQSALYIGQQLAIALLVLLLNLRHLFKQVGDVVKALLLGLFAMVAYMSVHS